MSFFLWLAVAPLLIGVDGTDVGHSDGDARLAVDSPIASVVVDTPAHRVVSWSAVEFKVRFSNDGVVPFPLCKHSGSTSGYFGGSVVFEVLRGNEEGAVGDKPASAPSHRHQDAALIVPGDPFSEYEPTPDGGVPTLLGVGRDVELRLMLHGWMARPRAGDSTAIDSGVSSIFKPVFVAPGRYTIRVRFRIGDGDFFSEPVHVEVHGVDPQWGGSMSALRALRDDGVCLDVRGQKRNGTPTSLESIKRFVDKYSGGVHGKQLLLGLAIREVDIAEMWASNGGRSGGALRARVFAQQAASNLASIAGDPGGLTWTDSITRGRLNRLNEVLF